MPPVWARHRSIRDGLLFHRAIFVWPPSTGTCSTVDANALEALEKAGEVTRGPMLCEPLQ